MQVFFLIICYRQGKKLTVEDSTSFFRIFVYMKDVKASCVNVRNSGLLPVSVLSFPQNPQTVPSFTQEPSIT